MRFSTKFKLKIVEKLKVNAVKKLYIFFVNAFLMRTNHFSLIDIKRPQRRSRGGEEFNKFMIGYQQTVDEEL